ncbi:MAG: hypothetical protein Q7S56_01345 [Nanoarchaeota archaeon]|nr:hypothetical protein [Nanoarchaeota archaeon]
MGLFGIGKKKEVIDLSEQYHRHQQRLSSMRSDIKENKAAQAPSSQENLVMGGFFGGMSNVGNSNSISEENNNLNNEPESAEEKRKRLAKRLTDMTDKIEEISNQVYHIQQRIEVLEKKIRVGRFENE